MNPSHTACEECDLLMAVEEIQEGARADCPRCGSLITQHVNGGIERAL